MISIYTIVPGTGARSIPCKHERMKTEGGQLMHWGSCNSVPVMALPQMSLPASARGIHAACKT